MTQTTPDDAMYTLHLGDGPLIATAIHDGHAARDEVARSFKIGDADRLREEDPFTGEWTTAAPTRVIVHRSRFEVDLNRPRERAVYKVPEDAWGLEVWKGSPPADLFARSLAEWDEFYASMRRLLEEVVRVHGHFVVYDLHSYNHQRGGPGSEFDDPAANPQVNLGTGTIDKARWGGVVDACRETLRGVDFPTGPLDVRENVKFQGGNLSRWVHEQFPETGVSLAIEFKKFFMDEWTGVPDRALVDAIGAAVTATVPPVLDALRKS